MAFIRLQKFLSQAGVASRRAAEAMIQMGRVEVDGRVVTELGARVDPERSTVRADGSRVRQARPDYVVLNKPARCLTSRGDPKGRPTVMDLLPEAMRRLFPVGRLDWDTGGLLLLTNDGELANRLLHPRYGVERIYRVKVWGIPTDDELERIRKGIRVRTGRFGRAEARIVGRGERKAVLHVRLREGRTGEIKDLCRAIGHPAQAIVRLSFGPLSLGNLPRGGWRRLAPHEVQELKERARKTPHGGPT